MVGGEDVCFGVEDAEVFVVGGEDTGRGAASATGDYVDVVGDTVVEVRGYESLYARVGSAGAS